MDVICVRGCEGYLSHIIRKILICSQNSCPYSEEVNYICFGSVSNYAIISMIIIINAFLRLLLRRPSIRFCPRMHADGLARTRGMDDHTEERPYFRIKWRSTD